MSIIKYFFQKMTPQQGIVLYYLAAIIVAFLLLNLPYVVKPGVNIEPVDTLFVAVSGVSVTGLTPVVIGETFTTFGQAVILVILNIGGIGVMAIGTLLWVILGKHIGLRERQLIMLDSNSTAMNGVVKLILDIVRTILVKELIGAMLLSFYFYKDIGSVNEAIHQGIFASVSATTNGGLDITGDSLAPYANDYFVQTIIMLLIMLGAIGFPVLIEVKTYMKNTIPNFRFSLFTKIASATYLFLFVLGTIVIYLFEFSNTFKGATWHKSLFYAMFQSSSTRSAGLSTIDLTQFSEATNFFLGGLMFIGSSPSSVGGGIRTTTFTILVLYLVNFSNGRTTIKAFNREVHPIDIQRSFAVISLALAITFVGVLAIVRFEDGKHDLLSIFFETMSAFGTCGLSMGITDGLQLGSKIVIMILMFIGRVGLLCFVVMLGGKSAPDKFHYPKERIQIG